MAKGAVREKGVPVALACRTFGISETCYRYEGRLSDENAEIADWLVRLAQFEWAWLGAYRAADARALNLADLARLDQAVLLDMQVVLHPAARLVPSELRLSRGIDLPHGDWLLVTRPDAEVLVAGGGAALAALFAAAHRPLPMAALLGQLQQAHPQTALLPLITLAIGAGALVHAEIA